MKILIVGDVYSKLGRAALEENIKKMFSNAPGAKKPNVDMTKVFFELFKLDRRTE